MRMSDWRSDVCSSDLPDTWKKLGDFDELCRDPRIQVHALNLTDTDSVERIARSIGGKVDILINTADYERDGGILHNRDLNKARDALDINCLGLMRLARYFGPAMAGRAAAGVNSAPAWEIGRAACRERVGQYV